MLVGLAANVVNQLDTRPGRALKAFLIGSARSSAGARGEALAVAVLLAPYDHREMTMLGDAGSNALGAVLGLESVRRFTGLRRIERDRSARRRHRSSASAARSAR